MQRYKEFLIWQWVFQKSYEKITLMKNYLLFACIYGKKYLYYAHAQAYARYYIDYII